MSIDREAPGASRLTRLMIDIQRRNQGAFAEFYNLTKSKIFATILMIMPHGPSAEDVVQEVYARVWNKAQSYDPTKSSPVTWVATIARNLAIDRIRRREFDGEASSVNIENVACSSPDVLSEIVAEQENEAILKALSCLKLKDRQLVEAAYLRGESREQLAIRFDAPVNTIKTWLRRALLDLQARCAEMATTPGRPISPTTRLLGLRPILPSDGKRLPLKAGGWR